MQDDIQQIATDKVIFREDLYPRIEKSPALVQKYAECLDVLPPIEVNQHTELIDGWHRWTAHRKNGNGIIAAIVTETKTDIEFLKLAIQRNAKFGKQLEDGDKREMAIRLYGAGTGEKKEEIAKTLSVTLRQVNNYLHNVDEQRKERRRKLIFDMWLACAGETEIASATELTQQAVNKELKVLQQLEGLPKVVQLAAHHEDDFKVPLYTVWAWGKKSNGVTHFGNSEQRIVDNLLYMYTQPFDIAVDPFAGGGSTIDVCKKRLRRYWVSDRLPIIEREDIRQLDCVADGPPPLANRWSDVSLTYLDPPYWKQAEGKYSKDAEDLANMPLEDFTASIVKLINGIGNKQSKGAIALLMQPTQWKNAPSRRVVDHVADIVGGVKNKKLRLAYRIQCPYQSEQCLPQMVEWAKEHRQLLVLSRELVVWEFASA